MFFSELYYQIGTQLRVLDTPINTPHFYSTYKIMSTLETFKNLPCTINLSNLPSKRQPSETTGKTKTVENSAKKKPNQTSSRFPNHKDHIFESFLLVAYESYVG